MCGIFGFSERTQFTTGMAPFLAWEMEDRGRHSWGCTNGMDLIRRIGPITSSWELPEWDGAMIFHTRAASCGAVTIENAHPFKFLKKGGDENVYTDWIYGVHNGCISNHDELNKRHSRKFEVDSMHIFANLAEEKNMEEINGWGAIAWLVDDKLNLLKFNGGSLEVALLESGEIVFASTRDPIERSIKMVGAKLKHFYNINTETHYFCRQAFNENERRWTASELFEGDKMRFGFRYNSTATNSSHQSCTTAATRTPLQPPMVGTTSGATEQTSSTLSPGRNIPTTNSIDQVGARGRTFNYCAVPKCTATINRQNGIVCTVHLAEVCEKLLLSGQVEIEELACLPNLDKALTLVKFRTGIEPTTITETTNEQQSKTGETPVVGGNPPDAPAEGHAGDVKTESIPAQPDPIPVDAYLRASIESESEHGGETDDNFAAWYGLGWAS